jgi:hypothetical protein
MAINVWSTPRNGRRPAAATTRPAGSNSRKCGSPKCRSIFRLHRSFGRAKSVKPPQQNDERVPSGARLVHQFARVGNMAVGLVKATCLAVRLRRRAPIRRHTVRQTQVSVDHPPFGSCGGSSPCGHHDAGIAELAHARSKPTQIDRSTASSRGFGDRCGLEHDWTQPEDEIERLETKNIRRSSHPLDTRGRRA